MADFMVSASTINFEGRRSSWMRKLTMYVLATAAPYFISLDYSPPSSAFVYLDLCICDPPLLESEPVPARLAPKGINVKEAQQPFKTVSTDPFNVVAGTLGTNQLRHLNVSLAWCSRVATAGGI